MVEDLGLFLTDVEYFIIASNLILSSLEGWLVYLQLRLSTVVVHGHIIIVLVLLLSNLFVIQFIPLRLLPLLALMMNGVVVGRCDSGGWVFLLMVYALRISGFLLEFILWGAFRDLLIAAIAQFIMLLLNAFLSHNSVCKWLSTIANLGSTYVLESAFAWLRFSCG